MKRIAYILSHPIQYHSPLFKKFTAHPDVTFKAFYCSNYGSEEKEHPEYGLLKKWDIPLLEGHDHIFLRNISWKPSIFSGFFGLVNPSIYGHLRRGKYDAVIVNGWNYFTCVLTVLYCRILGIQVYMRGDNTIQDEIEIKGFKKLLKHIILGRLLFPMINRFLYVGMSNRLFFEHHGIPDRKLVFAPHAVDNERFRGEYEAMKSNTSEIRSELRIDDFDCTFLFVGKFIEKKRPMDLLQAFHKLNNPRTCLLFVGFGPLEEDLKKYVNEHGVQNVRFEGFKNQLELCRYYLASDVFVLPSSMGETWGLVVNEAMNFNRPVILSTHVGSTRDLLKEGETGYSFSTGDVDGLVGCMQRMTLDSDAREQMGTNAGELVRQYSYDQIVEATISALD